MAIPASNMFASDCEEKVPDGRWSEFETIVTNEITLQNSDQDMAQILSLYNDLVCFQKLHFVSFHSQKV